MTIQKLIQENPNRFIFLAEQPRFANNNLGWIHVGKKAGQISGVDYFRFLGWQYRPSSKECARMFNSGEYFWNSGYFVSSIDFILREYQRLSPDIFSIAEKTISAKSGRQAFAGTAAVSDDTAPGIVGDGEGQGPQAVVKIDREHCHAYGAY